MKFPVGILPEEKVIKLKEEILDSIKKKFGNAIETTDEMKWPKHLGIKILDHSIHVDLFKHLKKLGFAQPTLITGIDWPDRNAIELVYHINRMDSPIVAWVRTDLDRENPRIPSITPFWKAADPHERETYEMLGVYFEGHPDLRHMLLPHDWNLKPPLRKDFKIPMDPYGEDYPWREQISKFYNPYKEDIELEEDTMYYLHIGPQHPAQHGLYRTILKMDGDTILEAWPDFGYIHRGIEKLAEMKDYEQIVVLTDRICYVAALSWNLVYSMAVEDLIGLEIPEFASWMRVILAELQRIVSHLIWLSAMSGDLGTFHSMFLYPMREREKFLDLLDELTGARLLYSYIRPGGMGIRYKLDKVPEGWFDKLRERLKEFNKYFDEYMDMTISNETFLIRTKGIAPIKGMAAIEAGATGPVLRAAGIEYDIRKVDKYLHYGEVDFKIPTGKNGDVFDRWWVRVQEIKESMYIIEQALDLMPKSGELRAKITPPMWRKKGEGFARVEDPRGEAIIYIVGSGTPSPYRLRIRSPTMMNLFLIHYIARGARLADYPAITGSLDSCIPEVDR
ncbi:MAG: NADH-quinone oxidoreductase subunit C [Candidatus Njordarchaeia archaeon]